MTVLLEAKGVTVSFSSHRPPAVAEADLAISEGSTVGIVGESGSGKTTLGRALVGVLKPSSGEVRIQGKAWSQIRRRDPLRRSAQMIFQDPYGSLNPWLTPRKAVAEVFEVWNSIPRSEADKRAEDLLREVGLSLDAIDRRPARLSGGQCQRVGIARALACDPRILVADEPTSSLDVSVQAQILNLLASLRERRGLALVLISHDLAIVRYATDEALVMYGGYVVERGPTETLFTDPRHPYTRVLVDSVPGNEGPFRAVRNELPATSGGCVFAPRCPRVAEECLREQPALVGPNGRQFACVRPLEPEPALASAAESQRGT